MPSAAKSTMSPGAAGAHVRNRDRAPQVVVPLVLAGLAVGYVVTLAG